MDLPAEPQLRWILRHTALLLELGAEPVNGLVLPTGTFFPDKFDGSPQAVGALMKRVQGHAGLSDLDVELAIVTPQGEALKVSCASGACGGAGKLDVRLDRVRQRGPGAYTVGLQAGEVGNPVVLTTALVRATGAMFLHELDAYASVSADGREPFTDLAGVMLGFGVLLANGSYIYMKGCGGVQVHSATSMPVDEVTVALAVFCRLFDVPERAAMKHLELTPSEHFDEAYAWASSNASVVKMLRTDREGVDADRYALSPSRSWLARVLGVGKSKRPATPDEELAMLEREVSSSRPRNGSKVHDPERARKLAELRSLVDECVEETLPAMSSGREGAAP